MFDDFKTSAKYKTRKTNRNDLAQKELRALISLIKECRGYFHQH